MFVIDVAEEIKVDPGQSMATIARATDDNKTTIHRTIHSDLNLRSYVIKRRQLLTEDTKERRKIRAAALVNELNHQSAGMLRFFSDEKNFIQD